MLESEIKSAPTGEPDQQEMGTEKHPSFWMPEGQYIWDEKMGVYRLVEEQDLHCGPDIGDTGHPNSGTTLHCGYE